MVVHRRADAFEGRSQLRSWLYGIAVRVALAFRRKAHVRREQLGDERNDASAEPQQERALEQQQDLSFLQSVLLELDAEKREAFVLYELEGMNVSELAAATQVPEGTALYRLHQARDEVKRRSKRAQLSETRGGPPIQRAVRRGV